MIVGSADHHHQAVPNSRICRAVGRVSSDCASPRGSRVESLPGDQLASQLAISRRHGHHHSCPGEARLAMAHPDGPGRSGLCSVRVDREPARRAKIHNLDRSIQTLGPRWATTSARRGGLSRSGPGQFYVVQRDSSETGPPPAPGSLGVQSSGSFILRPAERQERRGIARHAQSAARSRLGSLPRPSYCLAARYFVMERAYWRLSGNAPRQLAVGHRGSGCHAGALSCDQGRSGWSRSSSEGVSTTCRSPRPFARMT